MNFNSRYIIALVSFLVGLGLLWYFNQLVTYIIIAWVLSMIGAPIFRFFNRWLGRSTSAGLTLVSFTIILFVFFSLIVPPFVSQARNLSSIDYNRIIKSLEEPMTDIETWLIKKGVLAPKNKDKQKEKATKSLDDSVVIKEIQLDSTYGSALDSTKIALFVSINNNPEKEEPVNEFRDQDLLYQLRDNFVSIFDPTRIPELFGSAFGFVANFLIAFLSIYFITFFFLKETGLFLNMIQSVIPDQYEDNASRAIDESSSLLIRYFIGVITQISVITLLCSVILSLLGVKNAMLIGLFAGMMNVIPYIGPFIGMAFGTFITISSNVDLPFYDGILPILIKVLIVLGVLQLLDNFILQPNIFSKSVKAHPLEIFLVVLIGAQLGGVLGMILAIPVYTVIRVMGKVFFSEYKLIRRITKDI